MNRRRFLSLLGLAGAAAALPTLALPDLDPERVLWVPGEKRIFDLGAGADWRSDGLYTADGRPILYGPHPLRGARLPRGRNTFLTIDIITREALAVFERQMAMVSTLNRLDHWRRLALDCGPRQYDVPRQWRG